MIKIRVNNSLYTIQSEPLLVDNNKPKVHQSSRKVVSNLNSNNKLSHTKTSSLKPLRYLLLYSPSKNTIPSLKTMNLLKKTMKCMSGLKWESSHSANDRSYLLPLKLKKYSKETFTKSISYKMEHKA